MKRRPGRRAREVPAERQPQWRDRAACAGTTTPDLFHPDQGPITSAVYALCGRCPVRVECLEYALSFGTTDQFGVWGGRSASDRIDLLHRRRAREGSNS